MDRELVELFTEPGKGKGVRARTVGRGIRQGSLIIAEDPYIFSLEVEESKRRCHSCLQKKTVPLVCYGCKYARYCSETCQHHLPVERGQLSSISNLMSHVDDIKRQRAGGLTAMLSTLRTTLKFHPEYLIDQEALEAVVGKEIR
uniref:[histone H3]-lysine(4) N-trimethyltransferase n=1 Tax=Branchiostoma floridae TaxID=7739 RepID=C3XUR4_BRAFL|eukprot:XP_002612254.1 hypothetical protein BRAFLDRAFT_100073 [Branchiostoma floridae]